MQRPPKRGEKKSETLEIRMPYSQKRALMDRARDEGRSASEVMRHLADDYLAPSADASRTSPTGVGGILSEMIMTLQTHPKKVATAALSLLAIAFAFGGTSSFADEDPFERLDKDKDGFLTEADFGCEADARMCDAILGGLDQNDDGQVSRGEFGAAETLSLTMDRQDAGTFELKGSCAFVSEERSDTAPTDGVVRVVTLKNTTTIVDGLERNKRVVTTNNC